MDIFLKMLSIAGLPLIAISVFATGMFLTFKVSDKISKGRNVLKLSNSRDLIGLVVYLTMATWSIVMAGTACALYMEFLAGLK